LTVAATDHRSQAGGVDETVRVDDLGELFRGEDVMCSCHDAVSSNGGTKSTRWL
jgi:hypothetical protein